MLGGERPTLPSVPRRPRSDVAARRLNLAGRVALGLPLALVLSSGVLGGADQRSIPPQPVFGVDRVAADTPSARTGSPVVAVNRPPAPVGDPSRAVDPQRVIAIAGPVSAPDAEATPPGGLFLVGDSTFTAAARHLGGGSAFPGVGFELAPFVGRPNPLDLPPADFDGIVVIGISIWDVAITDADAYVTAVARYRAEGHPVLVVEVPERFGPGDEVVTTPAEEQGLRALNRRIARALGCDLAPWSVRDVETSGDVDGGDDHVHPTAVGVAELVERLGAVADRVCWTEPSGPLR